MKIVVSSGGLRLFLVLAVFCVPAFAGRLPDARQSPSKNNFDGPAELPRVYLKTSLADTPAPGKVKFVKSDDNLQAALDGAACGDTIQLQFGATFTGRLNLPAKSCDDAHWIIIRTSAPNDALPLERTRLTPCYAGVASLPGRPDFHCTSTRNAMAKIVFAGIGGSGPIFFAEGANHYRFVGIEVTRSSAGARVTALAGPEGQVAANHIIFDRVWMHGSAQDETTRGLYLSGTSYVAVVDSFFSDFHCATHGTCTDSQAIGGGGGEIPSGPYKIVNNFLEAAGENILFGGGPASITPADIEIRHNYMFKPITWMRGEPGFSGSAEGNPFIVKNSFELKNAQRVLFEGNVLENSWGGFTQTGFSVVLTPKNQNNGKGHDNLCPLCRVTDITIRYCKIAHVGSGFLIANIPAVGGAVSSGGERYSIHDIVIDDIDGKKYDGFGTFLVLISQAPLLRDVAMDHITALSPRVFMSMGINGGRIQNFTFTNNLIGVGEKQITSAGGGPQNCAYLPDKQGPEGVFKNCFQKGTFKNNAIINGFGEWPEGTFLPKNVEAVGFSKRSDAMGQFRLCRKKDSDCKAPSKYTSAGNDGKDIGADINLLNAATNNIF
jgi:hypothetical protein